AKSSNPMLQFRILLLSCFSIFLSSISLKSQNIPLAEHPRPDFMRSQWENLNGNWEFEFDAEDKGVQENWAKGGKDFSRQIQVPFPWGSALSRQKDEADIGWYKRDIIIPESWKGKRSFITIGAADWETHVWLDGELLGSHQGGYVPFSFELTDKISYGQRHNLVIRVDDTRRDFTLYGKQGYGNARGIWQTVYLEARGQNYLEAIHISPDIDEEKITGIAYLGEEAREDLELILNISGTENPISERIQLKKGQDKIRFSIALPNPRLWELEDPFLYDLKAEVAGDEVQSYFGMRKISTVNLPGTDYPYIALNNEPIYLQLALDQSYHPEGFYTFPSDQFMKEEIERSKAIGLNGIRTHIKVEIPRKLYWADKLGLLVMEDLPNSWGEPDESMQAESAYTLKEMIKRDYNHPSIFSWVVFNETWGLTTDTDGDGRKESYLPETQAWAASMYYLAKSLDMTRLVEDNSICCGRGHTETDINSWHEYLPGWMWENHIRNIVSNTYEGSSHHFEKDYKQGLQPNINSECGNVWGYTGSTGDVDWSWDYHRMLNTFRMFPKVAGWLYTEHHDVINEWNGYWRFDRTEKKTGLGEIMEGMSLKDLHADVYISTGNDICVEAEGGADVEVPLFLSVMTGDDLGKELSINYELFHTNIIGEEKKELSGTIKTAYTPWMQKELKALKVRLPDLAGISKLTLKVSDGSGRVVARNFMYYVVDSETELVNTKVVSLRTDDYSQAEFSGKVWKVMDGKKVNAIGAGSLSYEFPIRTSTAEYKHRERYFLIEASAKEFFVKDQQAFDSNQDYMKGSRVAPSSNPNSYPMTDETLFPSEISVWVNGVKVKTQTLTDDPADHRGILSWHAQVETKERKDAKLEEAGSYGYLVKVPISRSLFKAASRVGRLTVTLKAEGEGGIAIYGEEFGRYPVKPSLVLRR
ncbi:MAG: sugar-binding domain-containing protein, partial [Bacteroidota bacterium]